MSNLGRAMLNGTRQQNKLGNRAGKHTATPANQTRVWPIVGRSERSRDTGGRLCWPPRHLRAPTPFWG
eukprot:8618997-Lingulodinium_polyedra.AAC.1